MWQLLIKNKPELYDYDVFIFLDNIRIHIASGGAILPSKITNLVKNNPEIYSSLNTFPEQEFEINKKLNEIISYEGTSREQYLRSFENYAKKGFYSFDKTNINNPKDKYYHLVAYPKKKIQTPISIDLKENTHFKMNTIKMIKNLTNELEVLTMDSFNLGY